jgi:putative DNA primase/helicase
MSIDPDRIRDAHNADIFAVAARCGARLKRVTASEFAGPCPLGCARDDGFAINVKKRLYICRPSGAAGDVIAMAQHCLGLGFADAVSFVVGQGRQEATTPKPKPTVVPKADDSAAAMLEAARLIVSQLQPLVETPGEKYLRVTRRIDTTAIADVLKEPYAIGWHSGLRFHDLGHHLHGQRLGCIVGIMTDALTAKPTGAISRTYIDVELRKVSKAKTFGAPAGIVRLSRDEDVLSGLFLAEGLETSLAALSIGCRPVWSVGSTALMKTFPVLSGIEATTILSDHDANGAGLFAARECEARWLSAGREVRIFMSGEVGDDINDALRAIA